MAEKSGFERRVWVLPAELMERIRSFQESQGIASEVEAGRRLLDSALQMRDTLPDVLRKLQDRYAAETDLRVLARDILVGHCLVNSVHFDDGCVSFRFADGCAGKIDKAGRTYIAATGGEGYEPTPPLPRA